MVLTTRRIAHKGQHGANTGVDSCQFGLDKCNSPWSLLRIAVKSGKNLTEFRIHSGLAVGRDGAAIKLLEATIALP